MIRDTRTVEAEQFDTNNGAITGTATYEYDIEFGLNADIGGRDGYEVVRCELVSLKVGGLILTRKQVVQASCETQVSKAETAVMETLEPELA